MFKKTKSGFTLLELLVVVAVIIILFSVVMIAINKARAKSQVAAFKSETRSYQSKLADQCITTGLPFSDFPNDTKSTDWAEDYEEQCADDGIFSITASPTNEAIDCTATVSENGVIYSGSQCN